MNIVELIGIQLIKKDQLILDQVSLAIEAGSFTAVMGPSGAGKSSFLRVLNLLHSPSSGTLLYQGQAVANYDIRELRRQIGYVLQKPYLFGTTIRDNLEYPYQLLKQQPNGPEIKQYLDKVNLPSTIIDKNNSDLSGGEQQRVALVRSLLVKPKVLLLDEVTASLDESNAELIEQLVMAEQQLNKLTVLLITHSADQAKRLADHILYLVQGQVAFYGLKADYFHWKGVTLDD